MGRQRVEPRPGQESVWDYPRPPRLEDVDKKVKVVFGGVTLAYTTRAKRVLETSHPPVYYIPPEDIRMELLEPSGGGSHCEWKGRASYYDVVTEEQERVAGRVVLSQPDAVVHEPYRPRRFLPFEDGWMLGRGEEGRGAGGGLLRGLDHPRHSRTVQGRPRHLGLVDTPWTPQASVKNTPAPACTKPT